MGGEGRGDPGLAYQYEFNTVLLPAATYTVQSTDDQIVIPSTLAAGTHVLNLMGQHAGEVPVFDGQHICVSDPFGKLNPSTILRVVGRSGGAGKKISPSAPGAAAADSFDVTTPGSAFMLVYSSATDTWNPSTGGAISGASTAAALAATYWWIAPTSGSDSNDGTTTTNVAPAASACLKTFAEIVRRYGTSSPRTTHEVLVSFVEDQTSYSDAIDFTPICDRCNFYIDFVPTTVATDVISAWTPLNRAAGTDNLLTGTAIADFTPYAGMVARVDLATLSTRATGTTPPGATFSGTPLVPCEPIQVTITLGGVVGVARFAWFLNGRLQATGTLTAASVLLGSTGVTINFAAGTYNTTNIFTASSAAYCWIDTLTGSLKRGVVIGPTAPVSPTMAIGITRGPSGTNLPQYFTVFTQSAGTTPPAATFTGIPQDLYDPIGVTITTPGVVGVARFSWNLSGVVQATGVLTAAAVTLGTTGVEINFPAGTYNADVAFEGFPQTAYLPPNGGPAPNMQTTVAAGLSFTIQRPTRGFFLNAAASGFSSPSPGDTDARLIVSRAWVPDGDPSLATEGSLGATAFLTCQGSAVYQHCRIDSTYLYDGIQRFHGNVNCYHSGGMFATGFWLYGGVVSNLFVVGAIGSGGFGITVDGDTIIHASPGAYLQTMVVGCAHVKGATITIRNLGDLYVSPNSRGIQYPATAPGGATALWGGSRIVVRDGRSARVVNTSGVTATNAILLTGTPTATIDGISAAGFPISTYAAGVWSAGPATTPLATLVAALDAGAPGGGDTFAIQNPHTGSRIVMNGNNNAA